MIRRLWLSVSIVNARREQQLFCEDTTTIRGLIADRQDLMIRICERSGECLQVISGLPSLQNHRIIIKNNELFSGRALDNNSRHYCTSNIRVRGSKARKLFCRDIT